MPAPPLLIRQLKLGELDNFVYLIGDPVSCEAAVVDPAWDVEAILAEARRDSLRITSVLITHHHHDHTNGVKGLLEKVRARVYVNRGDTPHVKLSKTDTIVVGARHEMRLGERVVRFLDTPGHTPGSQCFLTEGHLFTGDTLFIGACGRVDFGESSPRQMLKSLREVLLPLPDDTLVWPGHDYDDVPCARLGDVKRRNRAVQIEDPAEFERYVTGPRWPDEE
ncbi:MAG: MBL fold metallo-hydrolase [Planctomycetota bacterium]